MFSYLFAPLCSSQPVQSGRSTAQTPQQLLSETLHAQLAASVDGNDEKSNNDGDVNDRHDADQAATEATAALFGEPWTAHCAAVRAKSPFARENGWQLHRVIVKAGDSLMQEHLAMQLLHQTAQIFAECNLALPLLTYDILATSTASGVIECVPNALSLDALRQRDDWVSLSELFSRAFGAPNSARFRAAHSAFVRSNAAYSIVSYLFHIKDRHNANVLLTSSGELCHIDFGFVLGKTVAFEKAPFKLTEETVEVMAMRSDAADTRSSDGFAQYCALCVDGFLAVRRNADRLLDLLEMSRGFGRCYPGLDRCVCVCCCAVDVSVC